ncbi:peptidylprolyl isomerase [candidate division KSB1 bacterium]|nr:peptidylprolyl isomerase [candidate division KSB1 bacterium]
MKNLSRLLFITIIILIAGCENYKIVARVGNSPIYVKDFKAALLKENGIKSYNKISAVEKENVLTAMIEERVQLLDAYRNNLDTDPKILESIEYSESRLIYETVLEKQIVNRVITEKDFKDRYDKISREIKVQQIFIPAVKSDDKDRKQKILNQLDSLRYLILRGEDFAALARKFSKDSLSAGKGGDLGYLKWDDSKYNDIFYNRIFKLKKGDVSKVFETKNGYHLVQVVQSRPVPVEPYDIQKPLILRTFYREKTDELNKQYYAFLEKLEKNNPVTFNDENIQSLVDYIQQQSEILKKEGKHFNLNDVLDAKDPEMPLFKYSNKQYTLKQFVADISNMYSLYYPGMFSPKRLNETLKKLTSREMIVLYGDTHGYREMKSVKESLLKKKEELMVKENNDLKVMSGINNDELKKYYEKNIDKFREPDKYKVQEIRVKDKELIDKIYEKALNNENFETLSLKYNENQNTINKKGVLGSITSKQYGTIGQTAASLTINEISKPIEFDGFYVIIKVLDILKAEQTPFDKISRGIRMAIRKEIVNEKKDSWLKEMYIQYPVIKYENVMENVFKKKEII